MLEGPGMWQLFRIDTKCTQVSPEDFLDFLWDPQILCDNFACGEIIVHYNDMFIPYSP